MNFPSNLNKYLFSIFCFILYINTNSIAQEKEWEKEVSSDGSIEVDYRIYKEKDEKDEEIQIVEYKIITSQVLDFEKCIRMMDDITNHKDFSDETEESYKLKDLSEDKSLIYYYIDAPWPMPNSDCVSILTIIENEDSKVYKLSASPDSFEMQDVKRMVISEAYYSFEKGAGNEVKITNYSKFSPVTNVPQWLLNTWFPKGPIHIMENIIAKIREQP
jgi:hypothetical protein